MYYLNARYYDPNTGRFINADDVNNFNETKINGLNLYEYCFDNPISYSDPKGNTPKWLKWLLVGLAAAVIIAAVVIAVVVTDGAALAAVPYMISAASSGLIKGFANEKNGGDFLSGFVGGVVGGLVSSLPVPFLSKFEGTFVSTMITESLDNALTTKDKKTFNQIGSDALADTIKSIPQNLFYSFVMPDFGAGFGIDDFFDVVNLITGN